MGRRLYQNGDLHKAVDFLDGPWIFPPFLMDPGHAVDLPNRAVDLLT